MATQEQEPGARPRFNTRAKATFSAKDPEALFGDLPRTTAGVGALWSHQADQLRTYFNSYLESADVALELPTGSGKTLVGLLIADWKRGSRGDRVAYACPTKQLAHQVVAKARAQGIHAVPLYGPHQSWDQSDVAAYRRSSAVAVTTYSSIFNTSSKLADAQTLLFDDAHAGESYVADAWAVIVESGRNTYDQMFDAFGDRLDPSLVRRMLAADGPASDNTEVRMLPMSAVADCADALDSVLATLDGDAAYRFKMVRSSLSSCLFYVSRSQFYIRPLIPPTFQHAAFVDPFQRIYLSATLGDAGELERAFGRRVIARIPVPSAWEKTGAGRRFFVFPDLAQLDGMDGDLDAMGKPQPAPVSQLMNLAAKRLILTPDDASADRIADELSCPVDERYTAKNADTGIEPFLSATKGTLLAANRYDGMDLPAETCRLMLASGLPTGTHLQERFLASKLRATNVLDERVRTRVLQGVGRCTRGPQDWAVVIVEGEDLLGFLSRNEVRKALPVDVQVEVDFGLVQSQRPIGELVSLAQSALQQDDIWREDAEPALAEARRLAERTVQPQAAALHASAPREVLAWEHAWNGDWSIAAETAYEVAESFDESALRPYRSLWTYLASSWFGRASRHAGDNASLRSLELLRRAHRSSAGTTWLKEIAPLPEATVDTETWDECAVEAVIDLLRGALKSKSGFTRRSSEMLAGLNQRDRRKYEHAAVELGTMLGARSFKPTGDGRADAVWLWKDFWITVEAKSEQESDGPVSMEYVRQANTQLASLAADEALDSPPSGSISVIASPRRVVAPDAVPIAEPHVHLVTLSLVLDIAHDAVRAWKSLRALAHDGDDAVLHAQVARTMWESRILPTQVRERLTIYRVGSA